MSKVLVVDNEASRVGAICRALERGGFETASATDGNEALRAFLSDVPDLVMVGPLAANPEEAFCRRMRETRPGSATPVVLFCQSLGGDALKRALERSGCNVYVELPASDERLIEVCRQALGEATIPHQSAPPATPASTAPHGALGELEAQGQDIEDHLDSMFSTGVPPTPQTWDAEPELSFETDRAELPPEPFDDVAASSSTTPVGGAIGGPRLDAPSPSIDPDRDLIGFEPNTVAFDSELQIDVAPIVEPDSPAEPMAPAEVGWEEVEQSAAEVVAASLATEQVVPPDRLPSEPDSLDLSMDMAAPEQPLDELPPVIVSGAGLPRRWPWAVAAVVAVIGVIGAAGLLLTPRPSSSGAIGESAHVAQARPVSQAPASQPTAPVAHPATPDGPAGTAEVTAAVADGAGDQSSDAGVPGSEPLRSDASDDPAAGTGVEQAAAIQPAATAIDMPDAVDPGPGTPATEAVAVAVAAPRVARPEPPAPSAPMPRPNTETIFQPSEKVMDADYAGEGFTPPRAINLVAPKYAAASVPAGGETIVVRALVNDWGKVVRVEVEQGRSGPLVDAAVNAILDTRYRPAEHQGDPVRSWTRETFVFK